MTSSLSPATPLQPRKRAILVGACGGLGTALTHKLAREGWTLALLSRREDCPAELAAALNADGVTRARAYEHDVTTTRTFRPCSAKSSPTWAGWIC